MLNDKVLSKEDIDNLWKSLKPVSSDDAKCMVKNKDTGIVRPIIVSNGYLALLSLDIHRNGGKWYHLSISNSLGIAKFEIAAAMAREVLGDCDQLYVGFRGVYHFVKSADEEGIHNIHKINNKNKETKLNDRTKEAKLNDGKVEGDINNGIEGRIKKKVQTKGIIEGSNGNWENVFGGKSSRICSFKRMESPIS